MGTSELVEKLENSLAGLSIYDPPHISPLPFHEDATKLSNINDNKIKHQKTNQHPRAGGLVYDFDHWYIIHIYVGTA